MIRFNLSNMRVPVYFLFILLIAVYDLNAQKKPKKNQANIPNDELVWKAESSLIEAEKQIILENYAKAYDLLLITRDINPSDPAVYFKLAEVVMQNGENEKALEYITEAIRLDDQNKYYRIFKAEIEKSLSRFDDAIDTYESLLENISDTESYLYELALLYQYKEQFEKALEAYDEAEDFYGPTVEVLREKQKIYLRTNDMEALMEDWDELITLNPLNPEYILEYASVLINNQLYDDASVKLKNFLEDNPDSKEVYLLLGEIERKQGNLLSAIEYFLTPIQSPGIDLFLKIQYLNNLSQNVTSDSEQYEFEKLVESLVVAHPESFQAYAYVGDVMMQKGKNDEALEYYRKAAAISPANFGVWQNIVNLEVERAEYDSLVAHAEKALEYFPNQSLFYFYGGVGYYFKENYRKSTQLLEQGKKYTTDPSLLAVFYGQLGDAYNSLKDYEKSDDSYEKALENDPNNDHALNNYSYFLSLRGNKLERAFEMSSKLVSMYPENPTYLDTHGWVLFQMDNFKEAEKYLRKAAELDTDGTILEHYGDVLFKLGRKDEALVYWKQAKESGGASENIDNKIESGEYVE